MRTTQRGSYVNRFVERFRNAMNFSFLYLGNHSLLRLISPKPTDAEVRVTEGCNSRCITCEAWKNSRVGELTTLEMVDAFGQLRRIGVESIRLSGGEPLIRSDFSELVKECNLLGFREIYLATNGLLLEKKAEELVLNGVTHFGVSLDGVKDTNDWIRGVPGHYYKVLEGIENIKKSAKEFGKEIPVTIFMTLLKQNISEVPFILEICEKIGARWCFSLLDGNLDFFQGIDVSKLAVNDWGIIDETVDYLKKTWYEKPWLIFSRPDILEYARNYMKGRGQPDVPCILGYKLICLGSKGQVYPGCYVFKPVGNIREEKLEKIMKSRKYKKLAEKMYRRQCPGCTFFYENSVIVRNLFRRTEGIRKIIRSKQP